MVNKEATCLNIPTLPAKMRCQTHFNGHWDYCTCLSIPHRNA